MVVTNDSKGVFMVYTGAFPKTFGQAFIFPAPILTNALQGRASRGSRTAVSVFLWYDVHFMFLFGFMRKCGLYRHKRI